MNETEKKRIRAAFVESADRLEIRFQAGDVHGVKRALIESSEYTIHEVDKQSKIAYFKGARAGLTALLSLVEDAVDEARQIAEHNLDIESRVDDPE